MIEQTIEEDGAGAGSFFAHIPSVLWERRWWIIAPLVLGLLAAAAALLLIKPLYQSSALMLVQSPQLPGEVIGQTGTELVDRRIARIRQQITSRPDLVSLIQRHGLYRDELRSEPLSAVVERMRASISLQPTSVETPGADQRTVAFQLSFEYQDPQLAHAVAQDLMDKILELDAEGNVEQATNTEQFLEEQAKGLSEQISVVEGQIRGINARYGGVLSNGGMNVFGGNGGSYDVQIAALQRDNANLISQKQIARTSDTRDPVLVSAETALAAARAVYADNHPDVIIAQQRLAEAKQLARNNIERLPTETLDQQIAFNNSQIAALRAAKAQEQAQTTAQLASQSRAPAVQQQIEILQQRLSGMNEQYQGVQNRLMAARAGVKAEDEQLSERLSVVEPPIVPDEPVSPDRLLILALGLFGGAGLGILLALGLEMILRPIRDPDALMAITGTRPLGMVPLIEGHAAGRRRPNFFNRVFTRRQ